MSYEEAWEAGLAKYQVEQDRLDAIRYQKLKAKLVSLGCFEKTEHAHIYHGYNGLGIEGPTFDAAVDALPDVKP